MNNASIGRHGFRKRVGMNNASIGCHVSRKRDRMQTTAWFVVCLVVVWLSIFAISSGIARTSAPISPVMAIPCLIQYDSALPAPFIVPLPDTPVTC